MVRKLLLVCALCIVSGSYAQEPENPPVNPQTQPRRAKASSRVHFSVEAINDPATRDVIGPKDKSNAVVRAQVLLDRNHFSPGEIDGTFGTTSQIALRGYQTARRLPVTEMIDDATWQMLNADSSTLLVEYTITDGDLKGPFEPLPASIYEQAKLPSLWYQNPEEMFGERFHISPALLKALNPDTDFLEAGSIIYVPNVKRDSPPPKAAHVIVLKESKSVTAYMSDGTVIASYPATIGSSHDPLPLGTWTVVEVSRNPFYHYNPKLFWDADPHGQRAVLKPGPNSPVGLVWIGLSKPHYGIHGTPRPNTIGHSASHGCVRLTNWDALELAQAVQKNTTVYMLP